MLINWVYKFHNEVNKRLGKPIYPKEQLHARYEESLFFVKVKILIYNFIYKL